MPNTDHPDNLQRLLASVPPGRSHYEHIYLVNAAKRFKKKMENQTPEEKARWIEHKKEIDAAAARSRGPPHPIPTRAKQVRFETQNLAARLSEEPEQPVVQDASEEEIVVSHPADATETARGYQRHRVTQPEYEGVTIPDSQGDDEPLSPVLEKPLSPVLKKPTALPVEPQGYGSGWMTDKGIHWTQSPTFGHKDATQAASSTEGTSTSLHAMATPRAAGNGTLQPLMWDNATVESVAHDLENWGCLFYDTEDELNDESDALAHDHQPPKKSRKKARAVSKPLASSDAAPSPRPSCAPNSGTGNARGIRRAWSKMEKDACAEAMHWSLNAYKLMKTNARWKHVSDRLLEHHGIQRSPLAVKDQWNRYLRSEYNIDERQNPKPDFMATSVQPPYQSVKKGKKKIPAESNGERDAGGQRNDSVDNTPQPSSPLNIMGYVRNSNSPVASYPVDDAPRLEPTTISTVPDNGRASTTPAPATSRSAMDRFEGEGRAATTPMPTDPPKATDNVVQRAPASTFRSALSGLRGWSAPTAERRAETTTAPAPAQLPIEKGEAVRSNAKSAFTFGSNGPQPRSAPVVEHRTKTSTTLARAQPLNKAIPVRNPGRPSPFLPDWNAPELSGRPTIKHPSSARNTPSPPTPGNAMSHAGSANSYSVFRPNWGAPQLLVKPEDMQPAPINGAPTAAQGVNAMDAPGCPPSRSSFWSDMTTPRRSPFPAEDRSASVHGKGSEEQKREECRADARLGSQYSPPWGASG